MEKKNVGLRIRIEQDLRDEFIGACQKDGKPAAQVLREFMRAYIARETVGAPSTRRKAGDAVR